MTILRHRIEIVVSPVRLHEVGLWRDWLGWTSGGWVAPWQYKGVLVLLGVRVEVEARHGEFAAALDALDSQRRASCPSR